MLPGRARVKIVKIVENTPNDGKRELGYSDERCIKKRHRILWVIKRLEESKTKGL